MSSEELSSSIRKLPIREATIRTGRYAPETNGTRVQLAVLCEKQEILTCGCGGAFIPFVTTAYKVPLSWNKYQSAELVHWFIGWLAGWLGGGGRKIRIRQTPASEGGVGHTGTTANSLHIIHFAVQ
jgi:hypothetical protein